MEGGSHGAYATSRRPVQRAVVGSGSRVRFGHLARVVAGLEKLIVDLAGE